LPKLINAVNTFLINRMMAPDTGRGICREKGEAATDEERCAWRILGETGLIAEEGEYGLITRD
jgi:hypothetical protein